MVQSYTKNISTSRARTSGNLELSQSNLATPILKDSIQKSYLDENLINHHPQGASYSTEGGCAIAPKDVLDIKKDCQTAIPSGSPDVKFM